MRFPRIFITALLLTLTPLALGQTLEVLHSFQGQDGSNPDCELIEGSDGNFYGTTALGGTNGNWGTIFKITVDGVLTTLVTLNETNGSEPIGALLLSNDGNLYGTTRQGGFAGHGTVFKMTPNGFLTTLASFDGNNGSHPFGGLVLGTNGNFYGTTDNGGNGYGTVFQMTTNGELTTLVLFNRTNGIGSQAGLTLDIYGNFYGTTYAGGQNGFESTGTVFRMTHDGALTTLFSFSNINGSFLAAGLTQGTDRHFYGTTKLGGSSNNGGTIFKISTNGALTTLVSFDFDGNDGSYPQAKLLQGSDGNFYGTTSGSPSIPGTVFRIKSDGTLTTLVSFDGSNGAFPFAGLVEGSDGNFYGTTSGNAGFIGHGTIFRIVMPVSLNSRVSGNELVLSWPTNHVGFTLQSSADLNSPTNWIDSTNAPAVVGAQFTVTNSLSASAQFYRLKKP